MRRPSRSSGQKNPRRKPAQNRSNRKNEQNWLYGRHAVLTALGNPQRRIDNVHFTSNTANDFAALAKRRDIPTQLSTGAEISARLPDGAVHQGIAARVQPLPEVGLEDLPLDRPVLVLDQVTDPHNVGAILRSAAVFNASGVIMTRRNSPPATGVLAKSACGALEHVHMIYVGNLSQALKTLAKIGFYRIGLDGDGQNALESSLDHQAPFALVLGAEGKGLRRLTIENCDELCHITTKGALSSLNVSNAAAIALHSLSQHRLA